MLSLLRWHAAQSGHSPALSVPGHVPDAVSYARLLLMVERVAYRLHREGITAPALVGLELSDPLLHIVFTLALDGLGAGSLSLSGQPPIALDALITDEGQRPQSALRVSADWLNDIGPFARVSPPEPSSDSLQRALLTSGTTGSPKAVGLTRAMIEARLHSYDYTFGARFARCGRLMCTMGLGSSLGYLLLLRMLRQGGMFCIPDTSIDVTARRMALYQVDMLLSAPSTLAEIWAFTQEQRIRWPELKLILTAGSLLPASLARKLRSSVCTNIRTFYGSTETGVIASADAGILNLEAGEVGYIVPGIHVDIKKENESEAGLLCIRGTANATSYMGEPADCFDGSAFYPGDLGMVSADGVLRISGRISNVINLGGVKTTIEAAEAAFSAAPGIVELAARIDPDALGVDRIRLAIVPLPDWNRHRFDAFVRDHVTRAYWPIAVDELPTLPRLANGKIDRRQLAAPR